MYGEPASYDRQQFVWDAVTSQSLQRMPNLDTDPNNSPGSDWVYCTNWQELFTTDSSASQVSGNWIIVDKHGESTTKEQVNKSNNAYFRRATNMADAAMLDGATHADGIIYIARSATKHPMSVGDDLLNLGKLVCTTKIAQVIVVTEGCQDIGMTNSVVALDSAPTGQAAWAFSRVFGLEQPQIRVVSVDVEPGTVKDIESVAGMLQTTRIHQKETELALREDTVYARRLCQPKDVLKASSTTGSWIDTNKPYVITGGLGGLGLAAALRMLEDGAQKVILLCRSSRVAAGSADVWKRIQTHNASAVDVLRCDVSSAGDLSKVFVQIRKRYGSIGGVLHTAGIVRPGNVTQMSKTDLHSVCTPKVDGAWNLHHALLVDDINHLVYYSSISALLGFVGQANYSFANGWLDGLSSLRQGCGLRCSSVQWGPWSDFGMAAEPGEAASKIIKLDRLEFVDANLGLDMLDAAVNQQPTVVSVMKADWKAMDADRPGCFFDNVLQNHDDAKLSALAPSSPFVQAIRSLSSSDRMAAIVEKIEELIEEVSGEDDLDHDAPLMAAGIDSLGAAELSMELQALIGDIVCVPRTILFDYPTINEIVEFVEHAVLKSTPQWTTKAVNYKQSQFWNSMFELHGSSSQNLPISKFDWDMRKLNVIPMSFRTSVTLEPTRLYVALKGLYELYPVLTGTLDKENRCMTLGRASPDLKVYNDIEDTLNFQEVFRVDCPRAISKSEAFQRGEIAPVTFELYQLKSGGSFFCAWQSHVHFDGTSGIWLLQDLGHIYNETKHLLRKAVYPTFDWTQLIPQMKLCDIKRELDRYSSPSQPTNRPAWFDHWCVGEKSRQITIHFPEEELRLLSKKAGSQGSRYIGLTSHVTNVLSEYFGWTEVDAQHILGLRDRNLSWYPNVDAICNGFFGTTVAHSNGTASLNVLALETESALSDNDTLDQHAIAYVQRQCATSQGLLPPFYPNVPDVDDLGRVTSGKPFLIFSGMHTVHFDSFEDSHLHQFAAVCCTLYSDAGGSGLNAVLGVPSHVSESFATPKWQTRLHTFN
jgi:NAD(P)-dependent dehydrogenase (short-subunit alcohol dehydrogenase family)/acyl carrier protein